MKLRILYQSHIVQIALMDVATLDITMEKVVIRVVNSMKDINTTLREELKQFLKGIVFVDKNDYNKEIPDSLMADWIISKLSTYRQSLIEELEGKKKLGIGLDPERFLETGFKIGYNTAIDELIDIIKQDTSNEKS